MYPLCLMELTCPACIQIILAKCKIPECFQAVVLFDQAFICSNRPSKLCQIMVNWILMFRLIRHYKNAVEFLAIGIDVTRLKKFCQVTLKQLRQKSFPCFFIFDQRTIERIFRKTYRQYSL